MAHQLLARHGLVTRETTAHEGITGGFSSVYQVLKAMEDAGRVRRGYFVSGLGGAQFAMPAAVDLLRSMRDASGTKTVVVSATDPASPYGSIVTWPAYGWTDAIAQMSGKEGAAASPEAGRSPTRTAGALVVIVDGQAAGYLRRGERELLLCVPATEPARSNSTREVAIALARRPDARRGMLIAEVDGLPAQTHPAARIFVHAGFNATAMGLQLKPRPGSEVPGA